MAIIQARPLTAPSDFGNGFGTSAPSADGTDFQMVCPRAMIVTGMVYKCDNVPSTSTITITLTKNGASIATYTITTGNVQTPTGFPQSLAAGDDVRVTLTNTQSNGTLTGFAYTFQATAV